MTSRWANLVLLILNSVLWFTFVARGEAPSPPVPVPNGWLLLPNKTLVLDVRHENRQPSSDRHAGELTQSILDELLNSRTIIYFSKQFAESELKYLETSQTTNSAPQTTQGMIQSLKSVLQTGELDWLVFRKLHISAPDSDAISRHLPWLSSRPDVTGVRLADAAQSSAPVLELIFKWSSIPMRGVVANSTRGGLDSRVYTGKGVAWKFDAELRLHQNGTNLFARSYLSPSWQARYETVEGRPLFVTTHALLMDIKTGLTPLRVSGSIEKKKPDRR